MLILSLIHQGDAWCPLRKKIPFPSPFSCQNDKWWCLWIVPLLMICFNSLGWLCFKAHLGAEVGKKNEDIPRNPVDVTTGLENILKTLFCDLSGEVMLIQVTDVSLQGDFSSPKGQFSSHWDQFSRVDLWGFISDLFFFQCPACLAGSSVLTSTAQAFRK